MALRRSLYLDQIKAVVVALVIALHVPMAFGEGIGWLGVRIPVEESVGPFFKGFFAWYMYAINSFIMPMMFLISGYFVPRSVHKKGVAQYLKARLCRLGIPFLVGMLLINNSLLLLSRLSPASPFAKLPLSNLPFNTVIVLWFLVVLFAFDLLYCAWVALRGDQYAIDTSASPPRIRSWLISALVLGSLEVLLTTQTELWTNLVRSPLNGLGVQGMHIFTYAFLFFAGCKASFHRWLERLDTHLAVKWFRFSMFLILCFLALTLTLSFNPDLADKPTRLVFLGNFFYPFIAWGILSYLILWFQRNENRFGQWLATAGVNSYGAYVIHSLILVGVLMAIGFTGINPWLIAISATVITTIISFGLAGQLRRIPAVARVI
jgi:fucose 4-O-acetylase-like acetyltransferase